MLKSPITKKVTVCFYNLGEKKTFKSISVCWKTSIMVLLEIQQRK